MSATWKQRPEGGGLFALGLIRAIARHGGRSVARLLLYPITLYFLLRRAPERQANSNVFSHPTTCLYSPSCGTPSSMYSWLQMA